MLLHWRSPIYLVELRVIQAHGVQQFTIVSEDLNLKADNIYILNQDIYLEFTENLLSTLSLGNNTPVKNLRPSGAQMQLTAEFDLQFPTFSNFLVSQISISPLRFPNPN